MPPMSMLVFFHLEIESRFQGEFSSVTPLFRRVIMYMHAKIYERFVRESCSWTSRSCSRSCLEKLNERRGSEIDVYDEKEISIGCCHRKRLVFLTRVYRLSVSILIFLRQYYFTKLGKFKIHRNKYIIN